MIEMFKMVSGAYDEQVMPATIMAEECFYQTRAQIAISCQETTTRPSWHNKTQLNSIHSPIQMLQTYMMSASVTWQSSRQRTNRPYLSWPECCTRMRCQSVWMQDVRGIVPERQPGGLLIQYCHLFACLSSYPTTALQFCRHQHLSPLMILFC